MFKENQKVVFLITVLSHSPPLGVLTTQKVLISLCLKCLIYTDVLGFLVWLSSWLIADGLPATATQSFPGQLPTQSNSISYILNPYLEGMGQQNDLNQREKHLQSKWTVLKACQIGVRICHQSKLKLWKNNSRTQQTKTLFFFLPILLFAKDLHKAVLASAKRKLLVYLQHNTCHRNELLFRVITWKSNQKAKYLKQVVKTPIFQKYIVS